MSHRVVAWDAKDLKKVGQGHALPRRRTAPPYWNRMKSGVLERHPDAEGNTARCSDEDGNDIVTMRSQTVPLFLESPRPETAL